MLRLPPTPPLFPYTPLFRSLRQRERERRQPRRVRRHAERQLAAPAADTRHTLVHDVAVVARHHPERSEEHTSELQSLRHLVCRLLLEKKKKTRKRSRIRTIQ